MAQGKILTSQEKIRVLKVLEGYGFGLQKIRLSKNTVANNNNIFIVQGLKKQFVLRESEPKKSIHHLKLEIAVLNYLRNKRFKLTPYAIQNNLGKDITIYNKRFYILQNFMPGKTQASWNNLTRFSDKKLANFFIASAKFTKTVAGFKTKIKHNRPIYYYAKNGAKLFNGLLNRMPNSDVRKLLSANRKFILKFIEENKKELDKAGYDKLPKQVVHFDLHPGNVNFSGDKVSGIFDFDWVRFDSRITDLAGTIGQSCYRYKGINTGKYNKRRVNLGLRAYRKAFGKSELDLPRENHLLKIALKAYMFYMLLWTMDWYLKNQSSPKALEWMKFPIKTLELNDYNYLFS
ncbi:MAG: phosphotransferase [Candidatus Doudnabacteria bacterium]|nr:phosphotransferase [Candidatus Doudnabacteria bacterium]